MTKTEDKIYKKLLSLRNQYMQKASFFYKIDYIALNSLSSELGLIFIDSDKENLLKIIDIETKETIEFHGDNRINLALGLNKQSLREKLAELRTSFAELAKSGLAKTGTYSYKYLELCDFIEKLNAECKRIGVIGIFDFNNEVATLKIKDFYNNADEEMFCLQRVSVEKSSEKQQKIQLLGAETTYLRRYLWTIALDLVAYDEVDSAHNSTDQKQETKPYQKRSVESTFNPVKEVKEKIKTIHDKSNEINAFLDNYKINKKGLLEFLEVEDFLTNENITNYIYILTSNPLETISEKLLKKVMDFIDKKEVSAIDICANLSLQSIKNMTNIDALRVLSTTEF